MMIFQQVIRYRLGTDLYRQLLGDLPSYISFSSYGTGNLVLYDKSLLIGFT